MIEVPARVSSSFFFFSWASYDSSSVHEFLCFFQKK